MNNRGVIYDGQKAFSLKEMSDRGWTISGQNDSDVEQLYTDTAWLYAVIQKRAGGCVSIPRILLRGETEVEEDDLDFEFDIADLLWRSSIAVDLYAKAYMLQVKNQFKNLKVRWFDPNSIVLEVDEIVGLKHFERQVGPVKYIYGYDPETDTSPDGLVWVWQNGMNEVGPGTPRADVATYPAMVLRAIDTMAGNFFQRGAISQHFFTSDTVPPKAERNRFRKWMERVFFGGLDTSHSVEIFDGSMKPHKLGSDPKDLEMTAMDQDNRRDISAVYDTPEALVTGDAGSLSRATLDRITSNWINGPIMQQTQLIVDAFNHHILEPEGYSLELNAEGMTVNQEEERQRAQAVSFYITSGFNPEWVANMFNLEGPEDIPMMAEKEPIPEQLLKPKFGPEEDESDLEPDEDESEGEKAMELIKLRRYIHNGKHLKRPFHSDVLTSMEIAYEVGHAEDAPFWKGYP